MSARASDLSIVIPARNARCTLPNQLDALAREGAEKCEVIVVDDGSRDGTDLVAERALQRFPHSCVIRLSANIGPAGARNAGARAASRRYLAFVDADDEVRPGWLRAILHAIGDDVFVTGPIDPYPLNDPGVAESRGTGWFERPLVSRGGFSFAASGNVALPASTFAVIGGFDEGLRSGEDIDFSAKMIAAGLRMRFIDGAGIAVRYRDTTASQFRQSFEFGLRTRLVNERVGSLGIKVTPARPDLRRWLWVLRNLPRVGRRPTRMRLASVLGSEFGIAVGLLRRGRR